MSSLNDEELLSFATVARDIIPSVDGKSVDKITVANWARIGVRGVKLETVRVGGKRATSREAIGRFFAALEATKQPAKEKVKRSARKKAKRSAKK